MINTLQDFLNVNYLRLGVRMPEICNEYFLTGSHAYGIPGKTSDVDIVFTSEAFTRFKIIYPKFEQSVVLEQIESYDNEENDIDLNYRFRFDGRVYNFIIFGNREVFNRWKRTTNILHYLMQHSGIVFPEQRDLFFKNHDYRVSLFKQFLSLTY